jgi:hypothetical protein
MEMKDLAYEIENVNMTAYKLKSIILAVNEAIGNGTYRAADFEGALFTELCMANELWDKLSEIEEKAFLKLQQENTGRR